MEDSSVLQENFVLDEEVEAMPSVVLDEKEWLASSRSLPNSPRGGRRESLVENRHQWIQEELLLKKGGSTFSASSTPRTHELVDKRHKWIEEEILNKKTMKQASRRFEEGMYHVPAAPEDDRNQVSNKDEDISLLHVETTFSRDSNESNSAFEGKGEGFPEDECHTTKHNEKVDAIEKSQDANKSADDLAVVFVGDVETPHNVNHESKLSLFDEESIETDELVPSTPEAKTFNNLKPSSAEAKTATMEETASVTPMEFNEAAIVKENPTPSEYLAVQENSRSDQARQEPAKSETKIVNHSKPSTPETKTESKEMKELNEAAIGDEESTPSEEQPSWAAKTAEQSVGAGGSGSFESRDLIPDSKHRVFLEMTAEEVIEKTDDAEKAEADPLISASELLIADSTYAVAPELVVPEECESLFACGAVDDSLPNAAVRIEATTETWEETESMFSHNDNLAAESTDAVELEKINEEETIRATKAELTDKVNEEITEKEETTMAGIEKSVDIAAETTFDAREDREETDVTDKTTGNFEANKDLALPITDLTIGETETTDTVQGGGKNDKQEVVVGQMDFLFTRKGSAVVEHAKRSAQRFQKAKEELLVDGYMGGDVMTKESERSFLDEEPKKEEVLVDRYTGGDIMPKESERSIRDEEPKDSTEPVVKKEAVEHNDTTETTMQHDDNSPTNASQGDNEIVRVPTTEGLNQKQPAVHEPVNTSCMDTCIIL